MRIGTTAFPGSLPFFLAQDLGYLDNSEVTLYELPNASAVMTALRNNTLDLATLSLEEALTLKQLGVELRIILVMDMSIGADVIMAAPGINSMQDLRNRRIGVEQGALGAYVLSRALGRAGMRPEEVSIVPLTLDRHAEFFHKNLVDAVVTVEPVRTLLLQEGATIVFDSGEIPGEIVDVLVAREDVLQERQDELQILLRGWFDALEHIRTNPDDAAEKMSPWTSLEAEQLADSFTLLYWPDLAENRQLLTGTSPILLTAAQNLVDAMLREQLLDNPVNVSTLLDDEYTWLLQ